MDEIAHKSGAARRQTIAGAVVLLAGTFVLAEPGAIRFEDVTAKAGVKRPHHTRTYKGKAADVLGMFTSGGASAAAGDFDNDGDDDLFVTDSDEGRTNLLYRNDGNFTFTDVTAKAGVGGGNDPLSIVADALWFDYDNDGWRDLLVARFGTPLLYHNEGNGTFRDVSAASGMNAFGNTIAALAFDFDRDGRLDVLLGNYFKPENLILLKSPNVLPNDLDNAVNGGGVTLWRNLGGGRFEEVTKKAGLANAMGWTLDVGHGDFDNDGLPDVYVAGDYGTDRVYFNNGDGTFADTTEKSIGFDTRKGMNVDVADYDNDGWLDVYVTNITDEYMKECNMLWHNNGDRTFTDLSRETGTCDSLWGWAAKFADFDNDRLLDVFAVNGLRSAGPENYIPVLVNMITAPGVDFSNVHSWPPIGNMTWSGYQKKKFFRNLDGHSFKEIGAAAGVDNDRDGRGLAVADFDRDGRLDFFQANANQEPILYRNVTEAPGNWIQLDLAGTTSNRDAIGARVTLKTGSGKTLVREVDGGNGYAGQSARRVHFGLGRDTVASIEIRWPSGTRQRADAPAGTITTIREAASKGSR
ncbi:MAG TPA: CRTAC1 family protein [Vicinamibacterales bacterium]|nr:CRTAC1 family protein [Vicinamibacterales bacterium]